MAVVSPWKAVYNGGQSRMRLLIISDIHANLEALEACEKVFPAHNRVANLGDVVGYGASPNDVVERAKALGGIFVRGNHDRAAAGLCDVSEFNPIAGFAAVWTRMELTAENRTWVAELPQGPICRDDLNQIQFAHGSPQDEDEYILTEPTARVALEHTGAQITFFGHTHVQGAIGLTQNQVRTIRPEIPEKRGASSWKLPLQAGVRYLVNPGSIGQPRDGDPRAAFALYDSEDETVTFYRIPYDIATAQQRIIRAGLPDRLALRLSEGR
jgi:diadenosine tetraphosphatase ApaH/serine/threonine PP2A family protein phosphatase